MGEILRGELAEVLHTYYLSIKILESSLFNIHNFSFSYTENNGTTIFVIYIKFSSKQDQIMLCFDYILIFFLDILTFDIPHL